MYYGNTLFNAVKWRFAEVSGSGVEIIRFGVEGKGIIEVL